MDEQRQARATTSSASSCCLGVLVRHSCSHLMCCGSLTIISIRKSEQGLEQKRDSWKTEIFRELSRKEPQLTYKNLMEMLGLVSENNGEYHIKPHSHLRTTPRLLHFVSHSQDFPATLYFKAQTCLKEPRMENS